jgi:hypothetical protein
MGVYHTLKPFSVLKVFSVSLFLQIVFQSTGLVQMAVAHLSQMAYFVMERSRSLLRQLPLQLVNPVLLRDLRSSQNVYVALESKDSRILLPNGSGLFIYLSLKIIAPLIPMVPSLWFRSVKLGRQLNSQFSIKIGEARKHPWRYLGCCVWHWGWRLLCPETIDLSLVPRPPLKLLTMQFLNLIFLRIQFRSLYEALTQQLPDLLLESLHRTVSLGCVREK